MKRLLCILLLVSLSLSLFSCRRAEEKTITCTDIVEVYEQAGYYVVHKDYADDEDAPELCFIIVKTSEESDPDDDLYFTTYRTEKEAQAAADTDRYHIVTWIFASLFGEHRLLKSGSYGTITYGTYNRKMLKPFKSLIK